MTVKFFVAIGCLVFLMPCSKAVSQLKPSLFDGIIIAGYADEGAYLNCTGPAIKYVRKPAAIMLGLLPSLRIKEDNVPAGASKNSVITPSLGFGLTVAYKHVALQTPLFYAAKTAAADGKWKLGVGLGYRF